MCVQPPNGSGARSTRTARPYKYTERVYAYRMERSSRKAAATHRNSSPRQQIVLLLANHFSPHIVPIRILSVDIFRFALLMNARSMNSHTLIEHTTECAAVPSKVNIASSRESPLQ